jgi:hypothetical protein
VGLRTAEGSAWPVVLFDYQPGHGHAHPECFLQGYEGTIMTDDYAAWRMLGGIKHLGCLAHVLWVLKGDDRAFSVNERFCKEVVLPTIGNSDRPIISS